jgi:ATP-dependent DNA helicase RecG
MNKKQLDFILQKGEGLTVEFKESFDSKNLAKEIVAFANSIGGKIYLGISDKSKIKGINITNKLKSQIRDLARKCDPYIQISLEEFKEILIINVKEGQDKPYSCKKGFYLRQGPNSQKLKRDEIINFVYNEGKINFDNQINTQFDFKKDFDLNKLNNFVKKSNITNILNEKDFLINVGVLKKYKTKLKFNNAGILFFAKKPCYFIKQSYITCIRFKGAHRADIIDRIDLKNDLINNIDEAIKFVRRNIRLSYEIKDIQRKEIPEYPIEVLRESIINAVMHRDYFEEGSNIFINIFDDRLEIYNPGGLVKSLNKSDLGKKAARRNPLIADLFHRIGYVEKAGTGIFRIKKVLKENKFPPPKIELTKFFTITFYSKKSIDAKLTQIDAKLTQELSNNEQKIISFISKNNKINSSNCQNIFNVSRQTANKYFKSLIKKKLIVKKGGGKFTYYTLKS